MGVVEASAENIMARCDLLAVHSEEPERLTRRFATPAMREVNEQIAAWMRGAGMSVHMDAIGNLIGRYEGERSPSRTLLLGSHLDTVRNAGRYDGPLGVMIALECVSLLHRQDRRLPIAIEIYGFADEEGLRYHSAYLGSKAVVGTLDESMLALRDPDGVTLAQAVEDFGGDPTALASCRRSRDDLIGYCEVHIEQGQLLEQRNLPVGVVTAIAGQTRSELIYRGSAGHAGTVPMALRRDALAAAAEFILAVETRGLGRDQLMATVGQIAVFPGASNVIPGKVELSLDLRHPSDDVRLSIGKELEERSRDLAARRGVEVEWKTMQSTGSVQCDTELAGLLAQAIELGGLLTFRLPSGAGHDAAIMAGLAPSAMLFLRCKGGISHSPEESVTVEDVGVATVVLTRFLELVGERHPV
jgi:allantoate deiminase